MRKFNAKQTKVAESATVAPRGATVFSVIVRQKMEANPNPKAPMRMKMLVASRKPVDVFVTNKQGEPVYEDDGAGSESSSVSDNGSEVAEPEAKRARLDGSVHGGDAAKVQRRVTLVPGFSFSGAFWDKQSISRLGPNDIIQISANCEMYMDRPSYKCTVVSRTVDSALTQDAYNKHLAGTALADIPTLDRFDELEDAERQSLGFVVPLFMDASSPSFKSVDFACDVTKPERLVAAVGPNSPHAPGSVIGFNMEVQQKMYNRIVLCYTRLTGGPVIHFTLRYKVYDNGSTIWDAYGVLNLESWKRIGYRLLYNSDKAYVAGFSTKSGVQDVCNTGDDEDVSGDDTPIERSDGFITEFKVNMASTAALAGLPLTRKWVSDNLGMMSNHRFVVDETVAHPINKNFRMKATNGTKGSAVNLSEMAKDQVAAFLQVTEDSGTAEKCEFYGVYAEDDAYLHPDNRDSMVPVTVFAVFK